MFPAKRVRVGTDVRCDFGNDDRFRLIAGPCLLESRDLAMRVAEELSRLTDELGIGVVFKASLEKANRTSGESPRAGMGWDEGLAVLAEVRKEFEMPVLTDIHEPDQVAPTAEVVDVLQIPAFLSRQTRFIEAAGRTGKAVAIKKGQFLSPEQMRHAAAKVGHDNVLVVERGTTFGYGDLIFDPRSIALMKDAGLTVVADVTHSVQMPGVLGAVSGGLRGMTPVIAAAAVAIGVAGIFIETHPDPRAALSDAAIQWPLSGLASFVEHLMALDAVAKSPDLTVS